MEVMIAFLLFLVCILMLQNRKLLKEICYLENRIEGLQVQIDLADYEETISALDLSKLELE